VSREKNIGRKFARIREFTLKTSEVIDANVSSFFLVQHTVGETVEILYNSLA